jgi:hypothetical protein
MNCTCCDAELTAEHTFCWHCGAVPEKTATTKTAKKKSKKKNAKKR